MAAQPPHRLDYTDHRRRLDDNRYVYAVVSRRARGLSIGINLNPDKVCNFDCPYCQVDRRTPGGDREVDLEKLEAELDHLLQIVSSGHLWDLPPFDTADSEHRRVVDIAFAGDGEPTSASVFPEAVALVGRLRAAHGLEAVRVSLLTNATLFQRPRVQAGLLALDRLGGEIWAKLDAGTEAYFQRVDGTTLPFRRVLDNLRDAARIRPILLQCMFMTLDGVGPDEAEIDAWVARIEAILAEGGQISAVQVYSVARRPGDPRVGVLPEIRLHEIAARVRALGLPVLVSPGVAQ